LRNFHNLYVKRKLILGVSTREDILIDYAVGKAGDLSKWIQGKLGFVFGIDVANDNITNVFDGACARYLKEHNNNNAANIPGAIFLNGNSSKNIRDGSAFVTEQNKKIGKAIFGQGPKDATLLGRGVYNQYDVASEGFHISSCQFAVHYFFENLVSLHGFLRNLAECTRLQGYFIGTCYDGETIFRLLKDKKEDEAVSFITDNVKRSKICEITKRFSETGFPDDELSVGYAIDVFQETINKTFREFLVNFKFFQRILENYGFTLLTTEEARQLEFPNATGLFGELYNSMETEIKRDRRKKANYKDALSMSDGEKSLSFMNRYFIFRKTTAVNAAQIEKEALKQLKMVNLGEDEHENENEEFVEQFEEERKKRAVTGRIKKLKVKIILENKKKSKSKEDNVLDLHVERIETEKVEETQEPIILEKEEEKEEEKQIPVPVPVPVIGQKVVVKRKKLQKLAADNEKKADNEEKKIPVLGDKITIKRPKTKKPKEEDKSNK
jgi:hypothetical protein